MDINISNFKKLEKSIDELLQLKRIYVEILEQLEEKIDFCDISWSCYLLEKYEQDLLFTDADFDHITESQEKLIDFKENIINILNNIELNILYSTNQKYKRHINKLIKQKESEEKEKAAALACDALIDEIAAQDLLIENNLYNDYVLSVA